MRRARVRPPRTRARAATAPGRARSARRRSSWRTRSMKMINPRPGWIEPFHAAPDRARGAHAKAQQEDRDRQHDVDQSRQQRVDPAAVVARDHAHHHADHRRDGGAEDAHLQRHARAVDHARHHVLAELVHAERVRRARSEGAAEGVRQVGVLHVRPRQAEQLDHQRRGDATTIRKTMKPSEAIATRSRRKRRQNSSSGERAATSPAASRKSTPPPPRAASQRRRLLIVGADPPAVGCVNEACDIRSRSLHLRQRPPAPRRACALAGSARARYSKAWTPCSTRSG